MRNHSVDLGWLALLLACGVGPAFGSIDLTDEAIGVLLDLKTIDGVLALSINEEESFERPEKWTTLRAFARQLPEPYRERLPVRDPWGGNYEILQYEDDLVVVSPGPDGLNDVRYELSRTTKPDDEFKQRIMESDDVILVVGSGIEKPPTSIAQFQQETLDRMRMVGTLAGYYGHRVGAFPHQAFELGPLAAVAAELSADTGRVLPLTDAWDNPLLYWSDGAEYMIVSAGADGVLDRNHAPQGGGSVGAIYRGKVADPDLDIVWANGRFVQWPTFHDHH
jgi:hypothetical protein